MKIGIDARMYGKNQSGIGTYIKNLTEKIFELDKDNDYYLFLLDPMHSQYKPVNERVHKIKVNSSWYSYAEQTKFLKDIYKQKLDLIHFPHFNAPILYSGKRIHTIHDITPKFFPGHKQKSWFRKKAYELAIKTSLKKSSKIITISQNTKNDLINYFQVPEDKIIITFLGIESHFKKVEDYAKIKEIKDRYGITKPYLFFISAWRNHKNFEGLIAAFEKIKSQGYDYQLVLGGQEDPYYSRISKKIAQSKYKKDIITPGFISDKDLPAFYSAAEIFIIPSFYEGFGIIGLEAMACQTPVISSNTTALPEILGEAALYFDPKNIQKMSAEIIDLINNPEKQNELIEQGLKQIKKYSWEECAQKTLSIYKNILNQ